MAKIVASLAALTAAFSPAATGVALHQNNSIHYPDFKSGGRQASVKRKIERYYGKGNYTYNKELVAKVDACMDLCERLLGFLTYDKVVSVAKNNWNITDRQASSGRGAGNRSSALFSMKIQHHIGRGATVDAPHYAEAAEVNDLMNQIKEKGGFDNYQDSVEFLLLACTIYMLNGTGPEHDKIMSAAGHNARCMYAAFGVQVRGKSFEASDATLVDFREERGREIADAVKREFRERTAGGQTAYVLAVAESGAMELPEGHPDRDKRCVGRLNATVAAVDAETLRVPGSNAARFADHAFHHWFLLVFTLHLGVVLPVGKAALDIALWA